jgi:DNA polymerase phi
LSEESAETAKSASGPWKPQLHYAWTTIFKTYFPFDGKPPLSISTFQEFYRAAVDGKLWLCPCWPNSTTDCYSVVIESLFSNTASPERKSWGFSVFRLALEMVPASEIPLLFTQNFMRTWINQLSGHDRMLYKSARQVVRISALLCGPSEIVPKNCCADFRPPIYKP